jgi:tripartite-type tricarboxylate transporter receptor subunit TctC
MPRCLTLTRRAAVAGAGAALIMRPAFAQAWPQRPVRIVVPATPGGAIDVIARLIADKLGPVLGQNVYVENRAGAGNNLGTDFVAKSPPDGYTLLIVASSHATNKFLYKELGWDPVKDFEPIAYTHVVPLVLCVNPGVPVKTVAELTDWLRANAATATYASSGTGSSLHMSAELYMAMTGVKVQHVPYRGSSAAHPDILGGRTHLIFDTVTAIQSHIQSGSVRALAVTTLKRSSAFPNVPTMAEAGLAGYDSSTWGGFLAPAGTPKPLIQRLNTEINRIMELPDVREKLIIAGIEIQRGTPEEFGDVIKREVDKWGDVIKKAGIQPQ